MSLIVKTKIKELAGSFNVAGDFAEALNKKCEQLIRDAIERAKANNRRTVMGLERTKMVLSFLQPLTAFTHYDEFITSV